MSHPAKSGAAKAKTQPKATRAAKTKVKTTADKARVEKARRYAINELDAYGCTIAEFRAMFGGISEAAFHRYAFGVRLRRRPTEPIQPTVPYSDPSTWPDPIPMEADAALEIATLALLRAAQRFTVPEIVLALKVNKTYVYDQRKAWRDRMGRPSQTERRMSCRYLLGWGNYVFERPEERKRRAGWKRARWVTRGRMAAG